MFLDTTTVLIFVSVYFLVYLLLRKQHKLLPPGPTTFPVVGNIPQIIRNIQHLHTYFQELGEKYGGIFCLRMGGELMLVLTDYELIKQALVKQADVFSGRPQNTPLVKHTNIAKGIIFGDGPNCPNWKSLKRLTLRALRDFGVGKKSLEERIQEEARAMLDVIRNTDRKPFEPRQLLTQAVCNIICSIVFGSRFEYEDEQFQKLLTKLSYLNSSASHGDPANFFNILFVLKRRKFMKCYREVDAFIEDQIQEHKESFDPTSIRDFVDLHIENDATSKSSSDTEASSGLGLRSAIFDLFMAGTDTSSATLNWILLYMICYPEIQQKCYEELVKEVGRTKQPSLADRQRCPYIEATLMEIQRHATLAPLSVPHKTVEDTTLVGYNIPKDTTVLINVYAAHMDPKLWNKPEEFRPERWLDENGQIMQKEMFMPFSIGPRACLGEILAKMEIFLFFTSMLQQFTFKMVDEQNPPSLQGCLGFIYIPAPYKICANPR